MVLRACHCAGHRDYRTTQAVTGTAIDNKKRRPRSAFCFMRMYFIRSGKHNALVAQRE
jgi:hypothetical protein